MTTTMECRRCGCLCDPGDIIGGLCDDCREQDAQEERRSSMVARYNTYVQMELEDFWRTSNGSTCTV